MQVIGWILIITAAAIGLLIDPDKHTPTWEKIDMEELKRHDRY